MSVVEELITEEPDGSISFGNYRLPEKAKRSDFESDGDLYKVKTYRDITKLERNGMFVYESTPGTAVNAFKQTADGVSFFVEGTGTSRITLELETEREYEVFFGLKSMGKIKTNLGGKLTIDVDTDEIAPVHVKVVAL